MFVLSKIKKGKQLLVIFILILLTVICPVISIKATNSNFNNMSSYPNSIFLKNNVIITYNFKGDNKNSPNYAEGEILVSLKNINESGTYYLYWADENTILKDFNEVCKFNLNSNNLTETIKIGKQIVIPIDATYLIAIKENEKVKNDIIPTINADGIYKLPNNKVKNENNKLLYSFGFYSDINISSNKKDPEYKYSQEHWEAALNTGAKNDVDFLVISGDLINSEENPLDQWYTYQRILAESEFCNPVYEAIGDSDISENTEDSINNFILSTGLDSELSTINKNLPYFEVTEPKTGDHFIFLALEKGGNINTVDQFSSNQIDWLEGLLNKYKDDNKNIFIIEHSFFEDYGPGSSYKEITGESGLSNNYSSTSKLKELLENNKKAVFLTGHSKLSLAMDDNYSNVQGKSARMINNSSVSSAIKIEKDTKIKENTLGNSEGYFVEVYTNNIVFYGANTYYNEIFPLSSLILDVKVYEEEEQTDPTVKPTEELTNTTEYETFPTHAPDTIEQTTHEGTTELPTEFTTGIYTEPTTEFSSTDVLEEPTVPTDPANPEVTLYGDADLDGYITVKDATLIQRYVAMLVSFSSTQFLNGDTNKDGVVNIVDATNIQKFLALLIDDFPANQLEKRKFSLLSSTFNFNEIAEDLKVYYRYSSYNQYQSFKKFVKNLNTENSTENDKITFLLLHNDLINIIDKNNIDREDPKINLNIYFNNSFNWKNVYVDFLDTNNNIQNKTVEMEYLENDLLNNKIYCTNVNVTTNYKEIIFFDSNKKLSTNLLIKNNLLYYPVILNNGNISLNNKPYVKYT